MSNQQEITKLLREAVREISPEAINMMLPERMAISISDHSTGCQIHIHVHSEGLPVMCVWEGSIWYSSSYSFNDDNKILGINPDFEFLAHKLEAFFENVRNAVAESVAKRAITEANNAATAELSRRAAIAAYAEILKS